MKISIRKFKKSDAKEFQAAILESVEHVSEWLPWCTAAYSLKDAIEWTVSSIKLWDAGTAYQFIIEDRETDKILGGIGINQIVPQHKIGNMGYWVRSSETNKGVCTRAGRLVIEYAFSHLGFQRIEIHVHPDNLASNAVASKLGGEYEGVLRNKLFFNGKSVPAKCYSVIPSDYET